MSRVGTVPGYETLLSQTPREIAYSSQLPLELKEGGILLDGTNSADGANLLRTDEIRAGWALGRITATGKYCLCKRTQVNATGATGTAFVVDNAAAFRVGDAIDVGADTNLTITAINFSTNTITVGTSFTWADNEAVVARDGSQTCRGFLHSWRKLRNLLNTAAQDKEAQLVVGGVLNRAALLGDIAAILADSTSVTALGNRVRIFNPTTGNYDL